MTKYVKVSVTTQYNIIRGVKPYRDISLDLNTDSESQRIIVSGNEFQTVGAEQRKARFAKSVLDINVISR